MTRSRMLVTVLLAGLATLVAVPVATAQNLLVNGGAEDALVGGEIPGWTEVEGATWTRRTTSPREGTACFYAGSVPLGELAQTVDVSALQASIDAGAQSFRFDGWISSYNQTPTDTARIVVEYRSDTDVLDAWDTGETAYTTSWVAVSDTRVAPQGTRLIRVRLITTRFNGGGNDGYFDGLRLSPFGASDGASGGAARIEDLRAEGTGTAGEVHLRWTAPHAGALRGLGATTPALDCVDVAETGSTDSGVYWLDPNGGDPADAFRAWCDLTTAGGGWTMCYTDTTEVHIASEITYDAARPYGQDGYRTDCSAIPFRDLVYVNHDGDEHAWFRRDLDADTTIEQLGYDSYGAELGTFTGHGATDEAVPYQAMVCDEQSWHPGIMVSGAGTCWKRCGNWCNDSASLYYRMRGYSYVGVAFDQPGHRDDLDKRMSVGLRRRAPLLPPAASAYEVRTASAPIGDATTWSPTDGLATRGGLDGVVAEGGRLTLPPGSRAQVDEKARVTTLSTALSASAGVTATDGTWIYAKPFTGAFGPPRFQRIGTGMDGSVAGQVEGEVGPDTTPSTSAAVVGGFLYNPIAGDPYQLERIDLDTGVLDTVQVPDGLLRRDTGRVEAGDIVIGSDGEHVISLAHSVEAGGLNGWRVRTYEADGLGDLLLLDDALAFQTSYAARAVLTDGAVVIPLPWANSSGNTQPIVALTVGTLETVGTTGLVQCSTCSDFDAPASGGYDGARGLFWLGDGVRSRFTAYPAGSAAAAGVWTSPVRDFGATVTLEAVDWVADVPAGAAVAIAARTSGDGVTWAGWAPVTSSGGSPSVAPGRYAQVRVQLTRGAGAPSVSTLTVAVAGDTWSTATPVTLAVPTPSAPRTPQEMTVTGVPAGDRWFAVRATSPGGGVTSPPALRPGVGPTATLDAPLDGATVSGPVPVSVSTTGDVTAVALRVDGASVATLTTPAGPAADHATPGWTWSRPVVVRDRGPGMTSSTTVSIPLDVAALVSAGRVRADLSDLRLLGEGAEVPRIVHRDGRLRFRLAAPIPPNGEATYTLIGGGEPATAAPDDPSAVALFHETFDEGASRWTNLQGPWAPATVDGRTVMERAVTGDTLGGGVRAWLLRADAGPLPSHFDLEGLVSSPSGWQHAYWGFTLYGGDVTHNDTTYLGINNKVHHGWTTNGTYVEIASVNEPVQLDRWHRLVAQVRGASFDTLLDGTATVVGRPGHLPTGDVGLWSEATYGSATAPSRYDDVTIWERPSVPPAVIVGPEAAAPSPAGSTRTWAWTWATAALAPGPHTLVVEATDGLGATTSAQVTVTVVAPVVDPPVITSPVPGPVDGTTVDVVGTAPAGASVQILLDGAPVATAPTTGGFERVVEAEDPANTLTGAQVTGGAVHVAPWPGASTSNVALGRPATANKSYNDNYRPSLAVDGLLESGVGSYWLAPSGATDAAITVDLGAPHLVDTIRLVNSRNSPYNDRSTKDYRLAVSLDGLTFTVVAQGTLTEDDWTTWVPEALAPPVAARWVRFHADSYYGAGAGLGELEVYGTQTGAWARVETPWLTLEGGERLASVTADVAGAGLLTHEVSLGGAAWLPLDAVVGAPLPGGQLRLRTTLVRTPFGADPSLDRLVVTATGAAGGAAGTFVATAVPLTRGPHTLAATATLGAVTSAPSADVLIDVDTGPPAAVVDLIAQPGTAQGSVVLTWTAPGDDGDVGTATSYELWRSASPLTANVLNTATVVPTPAPAPAGTPESMTVTGLTVGATWHWMLRAVDDRGKAGPLSEETTTLPGDTTAPSLTITAPAGGAHLRALQSVTVTTNDASGVQDVAYAVDGAPVKTVAASPFTGELDTTLWADGVHTIAVTSTDTFGNAVTKEVSVTFDNTAPTLALDPVATPRATAALVTYSTSDNLTPLSQIDVRDQDGRAPPFLAGEEGAHALTLTATDLAGNTTTADANFLIDMTGPSAIPDLVAAPQAGGVTLTWTAPSDALTAVASYEVRVATAADAGLGTGSDGPLAVTSDPTWVDDVRAPVVGDLAAGAMDVPLVDTTGFAPGDEVLLYAAQGTEAPGRWATRRVAAVGGGSLTLDAPLAEALYGATDKVFAQRVPQYTDVTVYPGGRLTAHAWDGQTGGLVAFRAAGALTIQAGGAVDATGLGLRGSPAAGTWECKKKQDGGAGESYVGWEAGDQPNGNANAGGGAKRGTCNDAAGGGGGAGATAGVAADVFGCSTGGAAGQPAFTSGTARLVLGGGGGEGGADEDGGAPGYGGRGGGLVLVAAASVTLDGLVAAGGADGGAACQSCTACSGYGCGMGGGGGGGGGVVVLRADVVSIGAGGFDVAGGIGGARGGGCGGVGGAGGAGRIRVESPSVSGAPAEVTVTGPSVFDWAAATPITDGVPTPGAPGAAESMVATGLPEGATLLFAVRSRDTVGNLSPLSNVPTVDASPPTVSIDEPTDGATLTRPVTVRATATDDLGLTAVHFLVDGAAAGTDLSAPWSTELDVRALQPGAHTLAATAVDGSGLEATDMISVTVAPAVPDAPVVLSPEDGALVPTGTPSISGTAEAWTTVHVYADGDLVASVPSVQASTLMWEAESAAVERFGLDAGADAVTVSAPTEDPVNLALLPGATVTGGSDPAYANNGNLAEPWYYTWRIAAACSETPTRMGRMTLPEAALVDRIVLHLYDDGRQFYGYRVMVSQDGHEWVTWADTAGSGQDYAGAQVLTGTPRLVRYVDVWVSGNTGDCIAYVNELEVFEASSGLGGVALMPLIADDAATYATGLEATQDPGDGAIAWELRAVGDLLDDPFDGNSIAPERWTQVGGTVAGGVASIVGANGWGSRYLIGAPQAWRTDDVVLTARVRLSAGGSAMVGVKDISAGTSYTALVYGLYLKQGALEIYEGGTARGTVGSYDQGTWLDVRVRVGGAGGATYSVRPDGGEWADVYVSTYSADPDLRAAAVVHSGTLDVDRMTLRAMAWWPAARLGDPDIDARRLRLRASLTRPDAAAASPSLDRASVVLTHGATGAGPGAFRVDAVPLADGVHTVTAIAEDAVGQSPPSAPVTFTVDAGPPDAVADLAGIALPGGVVELGWSAPLSEPVASYLVYRATTPIADLSQLVPIASTPATGFLDASNQSAELHYVVVAVDLVGNRSAASNEAVVISDKAGPTATVATNPPSPVGLGDVEVAYTLSEAVQPGATFAFVPPGGATVPLTLTPDPGAPLTLRGTLTITTAMASGQGELTWSGVDLTGNVGTAVTTGHTVTLDTVAPTGSLTLNPASPVGPGDVAVKLLTSEPVAAPPGLSFTPAGHSAVVIPLTGAAGLFLGTLTVDGSLGDGVGTFAMTATDAVGNIGTVLTKGATATVDTVAPPSPTGLVATKTPTGAIALGWTQPTGDTVTAWRVYRERDPVTSVGGLTPVSTVSSAGALDLPPEDGLWHYAVVAVDAAGNASGPSDGASVEASPPPPEDPTALAVFAATTTSVTVTWTGSVDSQGTLAGYRVYRDGALVQTVAATATAATLAGLPASSGVAVRITAFDAANRESLGATVQAWTLVPSPADVAADGQDGRVELTWTPSGAPALAHHALYVEATPFATTTGLTPVATVPAGAGGATVAGLTNGQPVFLAVVAVNKSGLWDPNVSAVPATPADHEAPAPPTALTVTASLETSVALSWTASPAPDLAGYALYQDGAQVATLPAGATSTTLSGLPPAGSVSVALEAFDGSGNPSTQTTVTAATLLPNPTGVATTPHDASLEVSWTKSQPSNLVKSYAIYAASAPFGSVTGLGAKATVGSWVTKTTLPGLVNGQTTWVAVTAINVSGGETQVVTPVSGVPADDAAPANPSGLKVTASTGSTITLAWTAPPNPTGDLAGYHVFLDGALVATLGATETSQTFTALAPGSAYTARVTAFDAESNESAGATLAVYTTLPNPPVTGVTPGHEKLVLTWAPASPADNVGSQALYVGSAPFASVVGKAPAVVVTPTATTGTVVGLTNGQTAHVAVVTVSKSGGFDPAVTSVPGTPAADTTGPTLEAPTYGGVPLPPAGVVTGDGAFSVTATDAEGVAWVRFLVDGASIGQDASAAGGFAVAWSPDDAGDGPHALRVEAEDVHGNASSLEQAFEVKLGPPPAPTVTSPADGLVTGSASLVVAGTAKHGATVRVFRGGGFAATVVADAAGAFTTAVTLAAGANALTATASGPGGESAPSAPVQVTLDTVTPLAPKALSAKAGEAGAVTVTWVDAGDTTPSGTLGYRLWRAAAPFTTTGEATAVTPSPVPLTVVTDLPPGDGVWWYGATKVSTAGLESPLSTVVAATSDATPPTVSLTWTPQGASLGEVFGVGPVAVTAVFDEPLLTTPFLALAPEGGAPLPVSLTKLSATTFKGAVDITPTTPSGVASAVVSARDLAGNRGTAIASGATLTIDTHAPAVAALVTDPAAPIQNDAQAPVTVAVTVTLDEPMPAGVTPELTWRLLTSQPEPTALPLAPLDPLTWVGGLTLPPSAGANPEVLAFAWSAVDELGNESTTIEDPSELEVYQGDLPPLAAPLGLTATAQPGGAVALAWSAVPGAAAYRVYRGPAGGPPGTLVAEETALTRIDATPTDGAWVYAIASVRAVGAATAESPLGPEATVTSDRVPPGAPGALSLALEGKGVVATWAPSPPTEPVTYRLLRSDAPIDAPEGATVVGEGIPTTTAVDPTPSVSQHTYAVIAADGAGNLSPPGPSETLNAFLLPVSSLTAIRDAAPQVTWTHGAADLAGFRVRVDGAAQPSLVTGTTFDDASWQAGPRTYGVTAVDTLGGESPERSVTLPDITATLTGGAVRRGVITKLTYALASPTALEGVSLSLDLGATQAATGPFAIPTGGATAELIVAGAPSLPDTATGPLRAEQEPNPGELVAVVRSETLPVQNDAYVLSLQTQELVRGAVGQVRLVLDNPHDVAIEVVTATGAGTKPSDEVRFRLEDTDGNILAQAALQQGLGEGVIQVPDGHTVGRALPGQAYTSAWVDLPIPEGAPDAVVVRAVVDAVHHDLGKAAHVSVPGPTTTLDASLVPPPYSAAVTSAEPAVSSGDVPIVVSGAAWLPDGATPAAQKTVRVTLSLQGFDRTWDLVTAEDGTFSLSFQPPKAEGGVYEARAGFPGLGGTAPQASFVVQKLSVTATPAKLVLATGYPTPLTLAAQATAGLAPTALRAEVAMAPAGITVDLPAPVDLPDGGSTTLALTVTGAALAPDSGALLLRVLSDEGTWAELTLPYVLTPAGPKLSWKPTYVQTGVARGDAISETLVVSNLGTLPAADVSLALLASNKTTPAPAWAFLATGKSLGTLAVGDTASVTLTFAPQPTTPLSVAGPTELALRVTSLGQPPAYVPVYVTVDDTGIGGALFKVADIYTQSVGADGQLIQGLAGASVKLDKKSGTLQTVKATTDEAGEVLLADLPAGVWSWRVSAPGHEAVTGTLSVKPGLTVPIDVFLPKPLVTVEWSVEETTLEDHYTVVLTATFETDVPAPVVVAEPASMTLPPMDQGDVLYGEYTLTNYGLIQAESITSKLPSATDYKFELLTPPPPILAAKEVVSVAYRVTRLTPAEPDGGSSGGATGGCGIVTYPINHCYVFWCANGSESGGCTTVAWGTIGSPSNGAPCGGPWSGQAWGSGGGGQGSSGVAGTKKCDPCEDPGMSAGEKKCCKEGKQQTTGSEVDLITGDYLDEVIDASIRTLGHRLDVARYWYDGAWHFGGFDANLGLATIKCPMCTENAGCGSGGGTATLLGITYEGVCAGGSEPNVLLAGDAFITRDGGGWRWENGLGDWRSFDTSGHLLAWGDRAGRSVQVEYEGSHITAFLDHFGAPAIAWEYGADGKVSAAETADGRRVTYTWESGRLTKVEDAAGRVILYTYDGTGRIVEKVYPSGLRLAVDYDGAGNVTSVLDEQGAGWFFEYAYNAASEEDYAAVIGTDGRVHERWWDKHGALVAETIDGEPVPEVDPQLVVKLDGDGRIGWTYNPDGSLRDSWEYGAWDLPVQREDARGTKTAWMWGASGLLAEHTLAAGTAVEQAVQVVWDSVGRSVGVAMKGNGTAPALTWSYDVDSRGLRTGSTDPLGRTTGYARDAEGRTTHIAWATGEVWEADYDAAGRLLEKREKAPAAAAAVIESRAWSTRTDADGQQIGERVQVTDEAGGTWTFDADARQRVVAITDPSGRTEQRGYDLQGRLATRTDMDGSVTTWSWEGVGFGLERETTTVDDAVVEELDRDRAGRVVRRVAHGVEQLSYYEEGATLPTQQQVPGFTVALERDGFGALTTRQVLADDGQAWTWVWENEGGLHDAMTDPFGGRWSVMRDALGRVTAYTDPLGATETYARDAFGRLSLATDANGVEAVALTHDPFGLVASRTLADGQTLTYERDARGRLTAVDTTAGSRMEFGYDARGRLEAQTATSTVEGVAPTSATYAWDWADRVISASNEESTRTTTWDDAARTRTTAVAFGPFTKTWSRRLDAGGRVAAVGMPDGTGVSYGYGPDGTVATIDVDGAGALVAAQTGPLSRTLTTPDGTVITHERDGVGRLVHTTVVHDGATLLERQYTWEADRLVALSTEHGEYAYTYDEAGRLTGATVPGSDPFEATYDAVGNRLTDSRNGSFTYDAAGRIATIGGAAIGWDAQGNMASRSDGGARTFVWSAANQLVAVNDAAGEPIVTYGYGPEGERVRKTVGAETTYALWTDRGLLAEYDAAGTELRAWGWMPGGAFGMAPVFQRDAGQVSWFVLDHRGAPVALVRGGAVVWMGAIDPFGEVTPLIATVDCPLRHSGQVADPETGLHHNWSRSYDPRLGIYLSLDPLLEEQGDLNLYQFADGSPLLVEDPLGLGGSGGIFCSGDGSCGGGGGGSAGGYGGLGGEVGGGAEAKTQDCCKDGKNVKNGQFCVNIKVEAEGGVGLGGGGGIGPFQGKLEGKLLTAGLGGNCENCNKCGSSERETQCCATAFIKGPGAKGAIGWVQAEITLVAIETKFCCSPESGLCRYQPPTLKGPEVKLGGGGDFGGE